MNVITRDIPDDLNNNYTLTPTTYRDITEDNHYFDLFYLVLNLKSL